MERLQTRGHRSVADMAGYSRLMERDEVGVLERPKERRSRRELIDTRVARRGGGPHRGRHTGGRHAGQVRTPPRTPSLRD